MLVGLWLHPRRHHTLCVPACPWAGRQGRVSAAVEVGQFHAQMTLSL